MKKILTVLTCALCALLCFVSCDGQFITGKTTSLTEVKFIPNLLSGKGLTVSDSPSITWLEYQAEPKYSSSSAVISGTVSGDNNWKRLSTKESNGSFSTGAVFTQGYWDFTIRVGQGTGTSSVVYYSGTKSCYLTGTSTDILVDMSPVFNSKSTGTLSLNITTPTLNSNNGKFKVRILDSTFTNPVTNVKDGSNTVTFDENYAVDATVSSDAATLSKTYTVVPGIYFLEVQYVSGTASTEKTIVALK